MLTTGSLALDAREGREPLESPRSAVGARAEARTPALTLEDVQQAMLVVRAHLAPTPLVSHPVLNQRIGAEVFVKLENAQAIGSFKLTAAGKA